MKRPIRLLPFFLLAAVAACQGDRETPATAAANSPAASVGTAPGQPVPVAQERHVETSFDLPAQEIVSIRLQPTASSQARVRFSELALVSSGERTPIDLCADKRLQLVRSRKLAAGSPGNCVIEFGNASGTGWIAPFDLRNLPANGAPRQLEVSASGDLQGEFRVYLDVGNGYGSRDMLQAESTAGETGAGG